MRRLQLANPIRPIETAHPPVQRYRYPFRLRTRWYVVHFKSWATWREVWANLVYLVRG